MKFEEVLEIEFYAPEGGEQYHFFGPSEELPKAMRQMGWDEEPASVRVLIRHTNELYMDSFGGQRPASTYYAEESPLQGPLQEIVAAASFLRCGPSLHNPFAQGRTRLTLSVLPLRYGAGLNVWHPETAPQREAQEV